MPTCGLIGTITSDTIEYDDGRSFRTIGGVLYQAAALCGGGTATALFSNCGEDLRPQVEKIVEDWSGLDRRGLTFLPGPGNRVRLRYSELVREREEFLESVVPALNPAPVLDALPDMNFLCLVFNSGFDIALSDWRSIADRAACPIWIDIHSLSLAARVGAHRDYRALPDWPSWVRGASYLQANRQEVACMMGHPERWADEGEIRAMAARSFEIGLQCGFHHLGQGRSSCRHARRDPASPCSGRGRRGRYDRLRRRFRGRDSPGSSGWNSPVSGRRTRGGLGDASGRDLRPPSNL